MMCESVNSDRCTRPSALLAVKGEYGGIQEGQDHLLPQAFK